MKTKILFLFALLIGAVSLQAQAATTAIATVGKNITMHATSDGTAPFTYGWVMTPTGSTTAKTLTPTVTDPSTFILANVQLSDSGTYTCTVKNSAGQAVGTANLTITPASPTTVSIVITIN